MPKKPQIRFRSRREPQALGIFTRDEEQTPDLSKSAKGLAS